MGTVKFSVIIPLYNKELYIGRALCSVLAQTIHDFEIIIVDDGSADKGAEIVKSLNDARIRLVRQANAGVSAARNRGIREAHGDLIAFLDADDEWKPEFLETILRLREKFPEAGLYAAAYEFVMPDGMVLHPEFQAVPPVPWEGLLPSYFKAAAFGEAPVCSSAVVVPVYVFSELGGFPDGKHLGEDLDMWGRIAMRYPVAFSRQTRALYHRDVQHSAVVACLMEDDLPFVKTAREAIEEGRVPAGLTADMKEYIAKQQLWAIRQNVLSGNLHVARRMLNECATSAFRMQKLWWKFWAMIPVSVVRLVRRGKQWIRKLPGNNVWSMKTP